MFDLCRRPSGNSARFSSITQLCPTGAMNEPKGPPELEHSPTTHIPRRKPRRPAYASNNNNEWRLYVFMQIYFSESNYILNIFLFYVRFFLFFVFFSIAYVRRAPAAEERRNCAKILDTYYMNNGQKNAANKILFASIDMECRGNMESSSLRFLRLMG